MSVIKKVIQANNEQFLGSWTLNCIPLQEGSKSLGKLFITNEHLYFESQFNTSLSGLLDQISTSMIVASGNSLLVSHKILEYWRDNGYLTILKSDVINITENKSFFKKTVTVELSDGSQYVFGYGMLPVSKITQAIQINILKAESTKIDKN